MYDDGYYDVCMDEMVCMTPHVRDESFGANGAILVFITVLWLQRYGILLCLLRTTALAATIPPSSTFPAPDPQSDPIRHRDESR